MRCVPLECYYFTICKAALNTRKGNYARMRGVNREKTPLWLNRQGLVIPSRMNERQLQEVRELARICNAAGNMELKLNNSMLENRPAGAANDFL